MATPVDLSNPNIPDQMRERFEEIQKARAAAATPVEDAATAKVEPDAQPLKAGLSLAIRASRGTGVHRREDAARPVAQNTHRCRTFSGGRDC